VVQIRDSTGLRVVRVERANAGGFYGVEPGGRPVTVSAANPTLHPRRGASTIDHDGQPLTIDLLLQNNLTDRRPAGGREQLPVRHQRDGSI
jgi:hypothetical protein